MKKFLVVLAVVATTLVAGFSIKTAVDVTRENLALEAEIMMLENEVEELEHKIDDMSTMTDEELAMRYVASERDDIDGTYSIELTDSSNGDEFIAYNLYEDGKLKSWGSFNRGVYMKKLSY